MRSGVIDIVNRLDEIDGMLSSPEIAKDADKVRELMVARHEIEGIAALAKEILRKEAELKEAEALCKFAQEDEELLLLAEEEIKAISACIEEKNAEMDALLMPKDPNADRNVIMEIRAGAGGEEAALFAADLFRMYSMYANAHNQKIEVINENETELGGFREISFIVSGKEAFASLQFESGVHRVQRVPRTESQGRIQTSTVTVAVLPEAEELDIVINESDLELETLKSSGAGGQHINKTESAVRILHKPSGIVVFCQEERSQFKNRDKAMRMLRTKLFEREQARIEADRRDTRRTQLGTGDRSEKIRTYNYPQSRVTDHRIGLTLHKLDAVLDGDLDELISALRQADTAEKMKVGENEN